MSVSGGAYNGAKGAFSDGYKGLHEVVTEIIGLITVFKVLPFNFTKS